MFPSVGRGVAPSMATHARAHGHPWPCSEGNMRMHIPPHKQFVVPTSSTCKRSNGMSKRKSARRKACVLALRAQGWRSGGGESRCGSACAGVCTPSKTMDGFAHGRGSPWMALPPTGGVHTPARDGPPLRSRALHNIKRRRRHSTAPRDSALRASPPAAPGRRDAANPTAIRPRATRRRRRSRCTRSRRPTVTRCVRTRVR